MRRNTSFLILVGFILNCVMPPHGFAQSLSALGLMPVPGAMVALTPAFTPAHLRGMVIHPNDPFKFDFIVYRGEELLTDAQKQLEYSRLIKYFLAALAVPDQDQWVNLSPYEKDRIIPDSYGLTEMGRDVLAQDYMLKQISASLTHPDSDLGKKFWDAVYAKSYEKFGTTNIPTETFNKVWIMPGKAVIFEKGNTVVVLEHHLKVMLDSDYRAMKENGVDAPQAGSDTEASRISKDVMREVIIPAIEKEVNEGKNFAPLRQIHSSMLLAAWYKRALKESILNKVYGDKDKVKGVDQDPKSNQEIYEKYTAAFKKGVFNMIKEDVDHFSQEVMPRKYFSGGDLGEGSPDFSERVTNAPDSAETADAASKVGEASDRVETNIIPAKVASEANEEIVLKVTEADFFASEIDSVTRLSRDLLFSLDQPMPVTYEKDKFGIKRAVAGTPGSLLSLPEVRDRVLGVLQEVADQLYDTKILENDVKDKLEVILSRTYSDPKYQDFVNIARKFIPVLAQKVSQAVQGDEKVFSRDVVEKMIYSLMDSSTNVVKLRDNTRIPSALAQDIKMFLHELPAKVKVAIAQSEGKIASESVAEKKLSDDFLNLMQERYPTLEKQGYGKDAKALVVLATEEIGQQVDGVRGGIDFTRSDLDMQIRRDGAGVPLPVSQQNLDNIHIDGLVPEILSIQPASRIPLFSDTGAAAS